MCHRRVFVGCPGPLDHQTLYWSACEAQHAKKPASDDAVQRMFSAQCPGLGGGWGRMEPVAWPGENAQAVVRASQAGNLGWAAC